MSSIRNVVATAKAIYAEISSEVGPPEEGLLASKQTIIMISLVRGTRGYIEKVSNQINGAYENGWYDACAVMLRRLIETLIIETFEHYEIADRIQNKTGDFLYLRDLIDKMLAERSWNLSRNAKHALPKLKDVGDKSAHGRRYVAQRGDIQPLISDIRAVVQELIYLSALKR
jgi:hypothetical protein